MSPQTGPLAGFGEADNFVVGGVRKALGKAAWRSADRTHPVEILVRDSQSDPNRAAEVASRLILSDKVDLMLVASTPETTNPVSDQCEVNGTPVHLQRRARGSRGSSAAGASPRAGFKSTYHFFWGLEDIIGVFVDMWNSVDDQQGRRRALAQRRRRQRLGRQGARASRPRWPRPATSSSIPGRYPNLTDDFSRADRQPSRTRRSRSSPACRSRRTGRRSGSRPPSRASSPRSPRVGKALLFPRSVEALGDARRRHVHRGVVDAAASVQVVADRRDRRPSWPPPTRTETKKQWTQPLGFIHALFEVGFDALKRGRRASTTRAAIVAAIKATNLNTIVGPISWAQGPGAQRDQDAAGRRPVGERGKDFRFDMVIVSNRAAPEHPDRREAASRSAGVAAAALTGRAARAATVSKAFGSLQVIDGLTLAVERGRGARRHRAERRRQDDRAQPDGRRACGPTRARSSSPAATSPRLPRARALPGRHRAAPTRSPTRSRRMTVFENVLVGATYGGGRPSARPTAAVPRRRWS